MTDIPSTLGIKPAGSDNVGSKLVASRLVSTLCAIALVLICFALVYTTLKISNPLPLGIMMAVLTALGGAVYWSVRRYPSIAQMLTRERAVMIAGVIACAAVYPLIVDSPYQIHVLAMGGIFAIMALGLNVNIGYAGLADFGYIAYYAIGAYASALLSARLGLGFWLCLPLAGVAASVLSLLVSFPALRVKGHYLALVTLGFVFIVMQLITNLASITGGTQGISGIAVPSVFGHGFRSPLQIGTMKLPYQANYYYLVLVVLVASALVCSRISTSRWGRAWAAMRSDEIAAEASGLSLTKLKLLAFGTGATFGGVAGSLYAHMIGFLDPSSFKFIESIFLLAVVVLGNFRIGGVILAAIIFTVLPEKLRAFDDWRLLIFGLALLVMMLVRGRRMMSRAN